MHILWFSVSFEQLIILPVTFHLHLVYWNCTEAFHISVIFYRCTYVPSCTCPHISIFISTASSRSRIDGVYQQHFVVHPHSTQSSMWYKSSRIYATMKILQCIWKSSITECECCKMCMFTISLTCRISKIEYTSAPSILWSHRNCLPLKSKSRRMNSGTWWSKVETLAAVWLPELKFPGLFANFFESSVGVVVQSMSPVILITICKASSAYGKGLMFYKVQKHQLL